MKRFLSALALSFFAILLISLPVQTAPHKSGVATALTALILDVELVQQIYQRH